MKPKPAKYGRFLKRGTAGKGPHLYVRFPSAQLHKQAKQAAKSAGIALNRFVIEAILDALAKTEAAQPAPPPDKPKPGPVPVLSSTPRTGS